MRWKTYRFSAGAHLAGTRNISDGILMAMESDAFHFAEKKNRFRRPGVRRDTSIGPGWRSLLIAVAFKVSSLWMVCDWTSNEASKHRTREKSEAAFRNSKEKKDGMRRESECTTDEIETMYESLSPVYKIIYILFYLSISLSFSHCFSFHLSLSLYVRQCMRAPIYQDKGNSAPLLRRGYPGNASFLVYPW